MVTGASSGIGREFARQLAAMGMNLILVARRKALLDQLGSEISQLHGIQARPVPLDLSTAGAAQKLKSSLTAENIKVRLLINNAAFGRWGFFDSSPIEVYEKMIQLNATAVVSLCHIFLPDLKSFPSSLIVNVSSQAAYNAVPYMAVYAASKAFVSSFSQALYQECKDSGIIVHTLVPGPTATEFDTIAGAYESSVKAQN